MNVYFCLLVIMGDHVLWSRVCSWVVKGDASLVLSSVAASSSVPLIQSPLGFAAETTFFWGTLPCLSPTAFIMSCQATFS